MMSKSAHLPAPINHFQLSALPYLGPRLDYDIIPGRGMGKVNSKGNCQTCDRIKIGGVDVLAWQSEGINRPLVLKD